MMQKRRQEIQMMIDYGDLEFCGGAIFMFVIVAEEDIELSRRLISALFIHCHTMS